jgi:hypothetical protein
MDAALASDTALFQRAVIDALRHIYPSARRLFAKEEPRDVMTRFTLTLRSPVAFALAELVRMAEKLGIPRRKD